MCKIKTAGIIVTYFPNDKFYKNLYLLSNQLDIVVVFDNTDDVNSAVKQELLSKKCKLLSYGVNLGIGKALNDSIEYLKSIGDYDYIFTFDQDTIVDETFVEKMIYEYNQAGIEDIIMFTPTILDPDGEVINQLYVKDSNISSSNYREVILGITSASMLIGKALFKANILFREDFFIDHVDHEFCLKARTLGYKVVSTSRISVRHELGTKKTKKFLNFKITYYEHSALRLYYFVRNGLILMKEYKDCKEYKCYLIKTILMKLVRIIFIEDDKINKLKYMIRGIIHYYKKIGGKLLD